MTPDPPNVFLWLDEDLRRVAAARSRTLEEHPEPQELVDYHLGIGPAESVEPIREHLSFCSECAQVVLDLAALTSVETRERALPQTMDLERDWQAVERRLRTEASRVDAPPPISRRLAWALAASLALSLGLAGWMITLRGALSEARQPRADIARLDLAPTAPGERRNGDAPEPIHLSPAQGRLLLLLNLGDLRTFTRYRLELLDATGYTVWSGSGMQRNDDGTFLLEIPSSMLRSQVYQVRLHGVLDGAAVPLATYSFEVVRGDLHGG
ncbi:MAG TPA: hypothetical protein DD490_29285 [Acidobacteria bacterium]|nr:hypothetical protein [Acidobacteriota bacterium]